MGLNTINHNALDLLLDEVDNLLAMQEQMSRKINLIEKLAAEVDKISNYQEDQISELQKENYKFNRAG